MVRPSADLELAMCRAWPRLMEIAQTFTALIGLAGDRLPETVARPVRIAALRLLRPAVALLRRLIVWRMLELLAGGEVTRAPSGPASRTLRNRSTALSSLHVNREAPAMC